MRHIFSTATLDTARRRISSAISFLLDLSEKSLSLKLLLAVQGLTLLITTAWVVVHMSYNQSFVSDQFITTYIFKDAISGHVHAAFSHSNILKLPLMWLVANIAFTYKSYVLLNFIAVISSFLLWAYLLGRFFDRRTQGLIWVLLALFYFASPVFAVNITEVTIRNIEYPLALLFMLLCVRLLRRENAFTWSKLALPSILLALLILHDYFYVYTLAPAVGAAAVYISFKAGRLVKGTFSVISCLILGGIGGVILGKVVSYLGIISLFHGYADATTIPTLTKIPEMFLLTIEQSFDMFGALVFGLDVKLRYAATFLCLGLLFIALYQFNRLRRTTDWSKPTVSSRTILNVLLGFFVLFIYLSYLLSNLANIYNARYLTGIVYVGVTYIAWFVYTLRRRFPSSDIFATICIILVLGLSIPKVLVIYSNAQTLADKQRQEISMIDSAIRQNEVHLLLAPNGYSPVRFFQNNSVKYLVEMEDYNTPAQLTNNSAWLDNGHFNKTAVIIDQHAPINSPNAHEIKDYKNTYGSPAKTVRIPSLYSEDSATLLIYNYDLRAKVDRSGF